VANKIFVENNRTYAMIKFAELKRPQQSQAGAR
jgi:hypothetical protein